MRNCASGMTSVDCFVAQPVIGPADRPDPLASLRKRVAFVAGNHGYSLTIGLRMRSPLQNRVTPTGEIIATPHRGLFTGNRGIIHDPKTKTLTRRWANRAWLTCVCEFAGRRREVMGGRSWTELFFLDEATALAAGHRPCFYCRRDDANRFRGAWEEGNGTANVRARDIDAVLHRERLSGGKKRLHPLPMRLKQLPDGAMVQEGNGSYLFARGRVLSWSPAGYRQAQNALQDAKLLTPPSTLRALSAGYKPALHPSAVETIT
jgi:hypothetical protein